MYVCVEAKDNLDCCLLTEMNRMFRHTAAVKKLIWRPNVNFISLATCSIDHCVKIFSFF